MAVISKHISDTYAGNYTPRSSCNLWCTSRLEKDLMLQWEKARLYLFSNIILYKGFCSYWIKSHALLLNLLKCCVGTWGLWSIKSQLPLTVAPSFVKMTTFIMMTKANIMKLLENQASAVSHNSTWAATGCNVFVLFHGSGISPSLLCCCPSLYKDSVHIYPSRAHK